jgi:hypothetical protein
MTLPMTQRTGFSVKLVLQNKFPEQLKALYEKPPPTPPEYVGPPG